MYSNSLTELFIRILFVICLVSSFLLGEAHPDTSDLIKSPKNAALSSIIPGGGQLYNGKKFKAGLILAGEVLAIVNWHNNSQLYSSYDNAAFFGDLTESEVSGWASPSKNEETKHITNNTLINNPVKLLLYIQFLYQYLRVKRKLPRGIERVHDFL